MLTIVLLLSATACSLATTPPCTGCKAPKGDESDCTKLNEYVKCLEDKDKTAACVTPAADKAKLTVPTACHPSQPCTCQITYWSTDFTQGDQPCTALKGYNSCLTKITDTSLQGCGKEALADLREASSKKLPCDQPDSTSTRSVSAGSESTSPKTPSESGSTTKIPSDKNGARLLEASGMILTVFLSVNAVFFI